MLKHPVLSELPPGLSTLSAHWGWLLFRGIAAVAFGILAFVWPDLTLASLVVVWGAYAVVDGAFALVYGIGGAGRRRWMYVLVGLTGIVAGLAALFWPSIAIVAFMMIVGYWALIAGICEIIYAIQYRRAQAHPWLVGLSGFLSVVIGLVIVMFFYPDGVISVAWLAGGYAIAYGILMTCAAAQLRRFQRRLTA
ncbi:HdeD family acid-resistance protein [Paraburkholderia saeva]|uniref:HdeD family acid-resistance protein n=1 Tax=Paraburkholderia saeva TaxID=2777537 RepID=A0A9N8RUT1_9BURK|nr:DUF308 domain-containing protein [Paraburkholderia saeva]CAG4892023.1 hypothetical protein LMG31841_01531 [Paraburkholderia saeva]CAG4906029.1 hypothetical protein R70241_03374 [Paraburkholderia saeva]